MSLENIFYLSQSIASVAVVGSLIYLALQVRYAERSQRGIMQQGRADRTSSAALTLADPELARVWSKGLSGDEELTPVEFMQWMLLCRASFLSGEDSLLQHKAGLLSPSAFKSYAAGARFYMANPGMRAAWKLSRAQFGSEFRSFGDSLVNEPLATRGVDMLSEWKTLVQADKNATTP